MDIHRISAEEARLRIGEPRNLEYDVYEESAELRELLQIAFYAIHRACDKGHDGVYIPIPGNLPVPEAKAILSNEYGYDVAGTDTVLVIQW